ncbi:hypothetical protein H8356DRAFT_1429928 [Neocallimastix lanati (nom. inval.)]|nr:hypothetical protein H8356DRAFT_1429928 [Neocallimastix sp. JGI-2020a]
MSCFKCSKVVEIEISLYSGLMYIRFLQLLPEFIRGIVHPQGVFSPINEVRCFAYHALAVPGFILAVKAFLVRPLPMPIAWLGFSGKYYTHLIPPISLIQLSSIYTSCKPERVECVWQSFLRGDTQHMVTYENLLILTYRYVMERLSRDPGDCGCKTQLVTVRHRKLDKGSSYKPLCVYKIALYKNEI